MQETSGQPELLPHYHGPTLPERYTTPRNVGVRKGDTLIRFDVRGYMTVDRTDVRDGHLAHQRKVFLFMLLELGRWILVIRLRGWLWLRLLGLRVVRCRAGLLTE